jgi:hypothetical protein
MTDQTPTSNSLLAELGKVKGPAPVHLWNPPYCGEIDIRIARDGTWFHEGSKITRPALVALFSSVLRREEDGQFCLVTPAERVGITVEDCPFIAVLLDVENDQDGAQVLRFTLNTGEKVTADKEHKVRVETANGDAEPHPVLHVRNGLDALISRNVFYQMVSIAKLLESEGGSVLQVVSAGEQFDLGQA